MIAAVQVGVAPVIVLMAPHCRVHVSLSDARNHVDFKLTDLALYLKHIPVADIPQPLMVLLRKMVDDLKVAMSGTGEARVLVDQLVELLFMRGDPSDELWMIQELAREIQGTISGMILNGESA